MRVLLFVLEFVIVAAIVAAIIGGAYGVTAILRRGRGALPPALPPARPLGGRWQARHYAEAGDTVVAVSRLTRTGEVVEEHIVARIPDQDSDWSRKFLAAKQEAEERAFHLNADGG